MWTLVGEEQVYKLQGAYLSTVHLTLFPKEIEVAGHVVILALYQGKLLFTHHKQRGLEWPGGKVEPGETPLSAALRELEEETGAIAHSMWLVGQYRVYENRETYFVKNIYAAEIAQINNHTISGEDTFGPLLFPINVECTLDQGFSPLVTDGVFSYVRKALLHNCAI